MKQGKAGVNGGTPLGGSLGAEKSDRATTARIGAKQSQPDAQGRARRQLDILKKLRIVIRAAQRHSGWIEKQCGVNGAQLWIMQELMEAPGMRVGQIAETLAIHQTTTSNLLDGLEKRGYIVKTRDPIDQRAVRIALSDAGAKVLQGAPAPARGLLPEALRQLDPALAGELSIGLQGLLDSIGTLDESFGLEPLSFTL
jgi:DNA-binding MarR family transcriptional regulator